MKFLFYIAAFLLLLFEVAKVYFIMPLPGSQEQHTIDIAYFLHANQWFIRGLLLLSLLTGLHIAWKRSRIITVLVAILLAAVAYMTTYKMAADTMFYQPKVLNLLSADQSKVDVERIVMGVVINNEAKAYPIQFLGYHHQVRDTIGGKPVMITYCTVCRTGRVFEPVINGHVETFRLVGMDHYNAMFEDQRTKSWWRQVNGEAVAGPLKGLTLPELPFVQASLKSWLQLYPGSLIMQPDSNFKQAYADMDEYESGRPEGRLTRYDTASWQDKSWVAGIEIGSSSKAYDWNELVDKAVINDLIDSIPVSIVLTEDEKSLFAFRRQTNNQVLTLRNDTLTDGMIDYSLSGKAYDSSTLSLPMIPVYQEYWHSWRTFHPETKK